MDFITTELLFDRPDAVRTEKETSARLAFQLLVAMLDAIPTHTALFTWDLHDLAHEASDIANTVKLLELAAF